MSSDAASFAKKLTLAPVLVVAAALLSYAIAPFAELVWDDQLLAKQQIAALRTLADVFVPPEGIPQWSYHYYRPVVTLTYVLDQALFGRGAALGPHLANVLYHALTAGFVWLLARRILRGAPRGEAGALVAALFFAVHPIHTESVSWMAGRSDVLAALFLLPALLAVLRWRDTGSVLALFAAFVLAFAAMMAKEVALAGVLLVPILLWLAPPATRSESSRTAQVVTWIAAVLACAGAAALYWSLRTQAGSSSLGAEPGTLAELFVRGLRAAGYYALKLLWPWPQLHFAPWSAVPQWPVALLALAVAIGLVAASFWWLRAAARAPLALALAWIAITLAPAFAVVVTGVAVTPVAERYLYLPSVGLALWAGLAWCRWREASATGRPPMVAAAAVLVVLGSATLVRGWVWSSDLRLWTDAAAKAGDHAVPLIELGKAQLLQGEQESATATFERAIEVADTERLRATANYNRGTIAIRRGRAAEAERWFEAARRADPSYPQGWSGLGRALYEQGVTAARRSLTAEALMLFARAEERQREALRLDPYQSSQQTGLAMVLAAQGELQLVNGQGAAAATLLRASRQALDAAIELDTAIAASVETQQLAQRIEALLRRADAATTGASVSF